MTQKTKLKPGAVLDSFKDGIKELEQFAQELGITEKCEDRKKERKSIVEFLSRCKGFINDFEKYAGPYYEVSAHTEEFSEHPHNGFPIDPHVSFCLEYENIDCIFCPINSSNYDIWDINSSKIKPKSQPKSKRPIEIIKG